MMRKLLQGTKNNLVCSEDTMSLSRRFFFFALVAALIAVALPMANLRAAGQAAKALTNQDISDMHRSGLSPDVIIAKIKAGPCSFDTTPTALQHLKTDKVPDNVILAMVNAPVSGKPVVAEKSSPAADAKMVQLHVYRQKRGINSTFMPSIFVDDKQVARVSNGSHLTIKLSAGSHNIRSDDNSSAIALDAKAGQEYYIRVDEIVGLKARGKLTMMTPEQGGPEYKLEKPLEDKHKIARDMIEDEGASK
jgi:hypothetical protein